VKPAIATAGCERFYNLQAWVYSGLHETGIGARCAGGRNKNDNGEGQVMKAFVLAMVAIAVFGVGSWFVLDSLGMSASGVYSTDNVRL